MEGAFSKVIKGMRIKLVVALMAMALVACAGMGGSGAPYPAMEQEFIPDAYPIRNAKTKSLQEFALTLPVYDSPKTVEQIKSGYGGVNRGDAWTLRTEGSQPPVFIQRLKPSSSGAQRIKVLVGPSTSSAVSPPPVWVYELERQRGGWKQDFSL